MRLFQLLYYGIFIFSFTQAQPVADFELSIEERLAAYFQLNSQERFDESLAYLYPPLFEVMGREELLEQLRYNAHHPDLFLTLGPRRATRIHAPLESRGNFYAQVSFTQELYATFKPEAAKDLDFIEATLDMFSNEFGAESLSYEPAIHEIVINVPKHYLAIRTDAELEWFFMELSDGTLPFLEGLLPVRVRGALK